MLLHIGALLIFGLLATTAYSSDSLEEFARKCDAAIGISVPDFDSDNGTLVPTTHFTGGIYPKGDCDRPNVLNNVCDPGSHFQVLKETPTAYIIAHARKQGKGPGKYGDIAVIQHNKVNGATCFYQGSLGFSDDGKVKAPGKGVGDPKFWLTPIEVAKIQCVGCHDNGPIIRSPYLAQITGPNKLPGAGDFSFNKNQPYAFVGSDFADWKAYQVEVNGNVCISCHRLGVNNQGDGGTARDFGIQATDVTQRHKNPHSIASPIWMKPGQITFEQLSANAAKEIRDCAILFHEGSPLPNSASCKITLFAKAFEPPRTTTPVSCTVFDDGYSNQSTPSDAIYFAGNSAACTPDGSSRGNCHKWFGQCKTGETNSRSVNFKVFNDGDSNRTIPFDAVYNNAPNVSCIPDGTPTGNCRRWFGLSETTDGQKAQCYLFDDGYTNMVGPTNAIYYRAPGSVCMPDGSAMGTCRKWFGRCELQARTPEPRPRQCSTGQKCCEPTDDGTACLLCWPQNRLCP